MLTLKHCGKIQISGYGYFLFHSIDSIDSIDFKQQLNKHHSPLSPYDHSLNKSFARGDETAIRDGTFSQVPPGRGPHVFTLPLRHLLRLLTSHLANSLPPSNLHRHLRFRGALQPCSSRCRATGGCVITFLRNGGLPGPCSEDFLGSGGCTYVSDDAVDYCGDDEHEQEIDGVR